ncbi:hypothetical protein KZZ05_21165, partial [Marinobacter adhaerens]|uniref:hypothetical protein n=1 Tax=Marinobacter adhaerens TaxID=1033846 RepID=UPI001C5FB8B7
AAGYDESEGDGEDTGVSPILRNAGGQKRGPDQCGLRDDGHHAGRQARVGAGGRARLRQERQHGAVCCLVREHGTREEQERLGLE